MKKRFFIILGVIILLFGLGYISYLYWPKEDIVVDPNISEEYKQTLKDELVSYQDELAQNPGNSDLFIKIGKLEHKLGQLSSAEGDYSFTFGDANTGLADYATIIGHRIRTLATATGSVAIGDNAGATTTDISTANRFHARFANGYLFGTSVNGLGNIDDGVVITGGINPPTVGIRTLTPNTSFALDVNGIIRTTGAVNTTSDRRLKEKIFTLSGSLSNIQKLRGTRYFLKDKASDNRLQFGVIAQEVETVFPNLVMTDSEGYKSVSYSGLIPVLIEATKEQQTIIEAQQEKISKLEIQVQELKELVLLLKDENDSNSTLSKKVDALEKQLTSLVNQLSELTAQK